MNRAASVLWLALVWVLLWGSFTLLTAVGGVLVGLMITAVFRPGTPVDRLPARPVATLGLLGYLARDLVASATQVSWQTLRYGRDARGAIVAVPLLSSSDRVVGLIAGAYTLSPGTLVLQIDHAGGVWYIYALGPRDAAGVEAARSRAMDMQRRVLAAVGAPDELAAAQRWLAER